MVLTKTELKELQLAILCNLKDAHLNENYIVELAQEKQNIKEVHLNFKDGTTKWFEVDNFEAIELEIFGDLLKITEKK